MKRNYGPTFMGSELPANEAMGLLMGASAILMGDERLTNSPTWPRVTEHLGWLMDRVDALEAQGEALASIPDTNYNPVISRGLLMFEGRTEMRIRHGDPQLVGTSSPHNPVDLEAAWHAQEAVEVARTHLNKVFTIRYGQ